MDGSPRPSATHFLTPSRRPTQHHCNADRKPRPLPAPPALAPLCRNIFEPVGTRAQQMR